MGKSKNLNDWNTPLNLHFDGPGTIRHTPDDVSRQKDNYYNLNPGLVDDDRLLCAWRKCNIFVLFALTKYLQS